MKKGIILITICLFQLAAKAQNTGGIWLSGSGIVSEGTGIHNGETPVLAIDDSFMNVLTTSGGGSGTGQPQFGDFKFRKPLNANTIPLFKTFGKAGFMASLSFTSYQQKQDGTFAANFTITLSNVYISKYRILSPECSGGNCPATYEEIALYYTKIEFKDNAGNLAAFTAGGHF